MVDVMDLVALEEIKRLKYRYLRCVDTKEWDELADTLTADVTVDYGTPAMGKPLRFTDRDSLLGFLRENLGPGVITTHFASQPEIDIDGDQATGTWCFEDTVIVTEHRVVITGVAFYEDRYLRGTDGRWRIAHTGYRRTYESMLSLDDLPSFRLTANRWAPTPSTTG
jgi:SnoaL-like domain